MLLPLPTLAGLFESRTLFTILASLASAVAVWAQARQAPQDPIADLTERVRHPVLWACRHPVRAIVRRLR